MSVVSRETLAHTETFAKFFGIDLELNRHIFRAAADSDSNAFALVMRSLAQACEQDARFGTGARIRKQMADKRAGKGKV